MTSPPGPLPAAIASRRYGCAIGAALGDAFGMPLEFGLPSPSHALERELTIGRLPAGTITDDTEMALALAESLVMSKPLDPQDLASRFVEWYRSHPPDVGIHTAATLAAVAAGQPWDLAAAQVQARHPNSAGNGSLMRCWPVALAYWRVEQREQLLQDSGLQSRVTHQHPDCVSACLFQNLMIVDLIGGASLQQAYQQALKICPLSADFEQVLRSAPHQRREQLANTGWVHHTMQSALWAVLTTDNYQEAVIQAANLGNDADTSAAVAGALAGAAYGLEAIPFAWRVQLRGVWPPEPAQSRIWREADFLALVDRL